jgi:hypothetical protein
VRRLDCRRRRLVFGDDWATVESLELAAVPLLSVREAVGEVSENSDDGKRSLPQRLSFENLGGGLASENLHPNPIRSAAEKVLVVRLVWIHGSRRSLVLGITR